MFEMPIFPAMVLSLYVHTTTIDNLPVPTFPILKAQALIPGLENCILIALRLTAIGAINRSGCEEYHPIRHPEWAEKNQGRTLIAEHRPPYLYPSFK